MGLKISGTVRDLDTGEGVPGAQVRVLDKDLLFHDQLGQTTTGDDGAYAIEIPADTGWGPLGDRPDVFVEVYTVESPAGLLASTRQCVKKNVTKSTQIDVDIPHVRLVEMGLADHLPPTWMQAIDPQRLAMFKTWTWRDDIDASDELAVQLSTDLGDRSVLELMKSYIDALKLDPDNDAVPFLKLKRLFELGLTPESISGHFYGVPVGIRTGDLEGSVAEVGNILGFLWGAAVQGVCPWVGKSFRSIGDEQRNRLTNGALEASPVYLGINHFNRIDLQLINVASFHLLSLWMGLAEAPPVERRLYGHERDGGRFVACRTASVYPGSERIVFQLNYRWSDLGNPPPFSWLIDELVQVAEGLYLGQLLFATRRLLSPYDPAREEDSSYQHFGYFLLFDERWNPEARRLLPHLEMPVTAPGMRPIEPGDASKLRTFTFDEATPANANATVLAEIEDDARSSPTILHLLQRYSNELHESLDNSAPAFLRLQEMFRRGHSIETMEGFFHGALVNPSIVSMLKGSSMVHW